MTLARIRLRYRDLNAKCRGEECYRLVIDLDAGTAKWATDVAECVEGDWPRRGIRAAERRCAQTGLLPVGTLLLEIEKDVGRGGGSPRYAVGRLRLKEGEENEGRGRIEWIPKAHRRAKRDGGAFVHIIELDGQRYEIKG